MQTKGKSHATKKVATAVAKPRRTKNNDNTKSTTRVRKSTQAVRPRADRVSRVHSQPIDDSHYLDAIRRAKDEATAARAANRDLVREFNEVYRVSARDWIAVLLMGLVVMVTGFMAAWILG